MSRGDVEISNLQIFSTEESGGTTVIVISCRARSCAETRSVPAFARISIFALVLALASTSAADPSGYAPLAAAAIPTTLGDYMVIWSAGAQPADAYRIYGVTATGMVFVDEVAASSGSASVPAGFEGYAVRGVKDGVESEPRTAATVGLDCLYVTYTPPPPNFWLGPCYGSGGFVFGDCAIVTFAYGLGSCGPSEKLGPVRGILGLP